MVLVLVNCIAFEGDFEGAAEGWWALSGPPGRLQPRAATVAGPQQLPPSRLSPGPETLSRRVRVDHSVGVIHGCELELVMETPGDSR